uniref:Uncharacterized protein n=1 Tax=Leifsonia xyli subsp. xyli TaxID=59736 RepID=Q7X3N2_LEIXY|nr:hypothetical protein [Leifsonia xyli subsp. xyli]
MVGPAQARVIEVWARLAVPLHETLLLQTGEDREHGRERRGLPPLPVRRQFVAQFVGGDRDAVAPQGLHDGPLQFSEVCHGPSVMRRADECSTICIRSNSTVCRIRLKGSPCERMARPALALAVAVRSHHHLPFPVRAAHHRPRDGRRRVPDRLVSHGQSPLPAIDPLLREALPHQLRDGSGDRHRAGVPVRDELVRLLALRRRHLRRPARPGGSARFLPRSDLHRPLDLRLGQTAEGSAPRHGLGDRRRHHPLRLFHHRGQRLHAESGRLPPQRVPWPGGADGHRRGADQQSRPRGLPAHHLRHVHGLRRSDHLGRRLAPLPQPAPRVDAAGAQSRSVADGRREHQHRDLRRPAGPRYGADAAHEDGGGGGAVQNLDGRGRIVLHFHARDTGRRA